MPQKSFGMKEQHRLAVGADLRLALAKNPRALRHEPVARFPDVGHLVAEMVDAAVGVAFEESGNRRLVAEHAEQLDLGVGQLDEDRGHAMLGLIDLIGDLGPQRVAVDRGRRLQVRHGNGDMIQTPDHKRLPIS